MTSGLNDSLDLVEAAIVESERGRNVRSGRAGQQNADQLEAL